MSVTEALSILRHLCGLIAASQGFRARHRLAHMYLAAFLQLGRLAILPRVRSLSVCSSLSLSLSPARISGWPSCQRDWPSRPSSGLCKRAPSLCVSPTNLAPSPANTGTNRARLVLQVRQCAHSLARSLAVSSTAPARRTNHQPPLELPTTTTGAQPPRDVRVGAAWTPRAHPGRLRSQHAGAFT